MKSDADDAVTLKRNPVRRQLNRFVIPLFLSLIVIMTAISMINQYVTINRETINLMRSHARVLAQNNTAVLLFEDADSAVESLQGLKLIPGFIFAAIYVHSTNILATYPEPQLNSPLPTITGSGFHEQGGILHVYEPVVLEDEVIGGVYLQYDMAFAYAGLLRSGLVEVGTELLLLLALFIMLSRFVKKFTLPIAQLHEASKQILLSGDYAVRVQKITRDEFGDLSDAFNDMLAQVQARDKKLAETAIELEERVRLRTRELELAKKAAEQSTIAKSKFLASMSHEIRTPLNGIIGMTALMSDTDMDENQREYARTIAYSSELLLSIINDVLDFSKIEAGKMTLESIPFNLERALEDLCNLEKIATEKKGIYLQLFIDDDVPRHVLGDSGKIFQIMMNLLSNAIKFTHDGGVLLKVEKSVAKAPLQHEVALQFSVIDTGVGIHAHKTESIFEEFRQEDNSTTRNYGGTGLGLAICKKLALLMGGDVSLKSEVKKGSEFYLTLCLTVDREAEKVYRQQQQQLQGLPHCRVLIVGEATVEPVIRHWLHSLGASYKAVADIDQATAAMGESFSFDIILIDEAMGRAACDRLLAHIQRKPVWHEHSRSLLINHSLIKDEGKEVSAAGYGGVLSRPFYKEQLRLMLCECMEQISGSKNTRFLRTVMLGRHVEKDRDQQLQGKRILLAEDNAVNQIVGQKLLSKLGASVDIAENGEEAVSMWSSSSYDAIIMDCHMPVMDGYEATRSIRRKENNQQHIPIIALTANAMQGERQVCLQAGMDDYLTKPLKDELLSETLMHCMAQERVEHGPELGPHGPEPGPHGQEPGKH